MRILHARVISQENHGAFGQAKCPDHRRRILGHKQPVLVWVCIFRFSFKLVKKKL